MKLKMSEYLLGIKPELSRIIDILGKKYEYVSILGTDVKGKQYSASKLSTNIKDSPDCERGFVVRVYNGKFYTEYSFNEVDVDSVVKEVHKTATEDIKKIEEQSIEVSEYPVIKEDAVIDLFEADVELSIDDIKASEIVNKLRKAVEEGLAYSDKIVEVHSIFSYVHVSKIFMSKDRDLAQSYAYSTGYDIAIASDGEKFVEEIDAYSGLCGAELLEDISEGSVRVCEKAIELLTADRIIPGEYDIICDPDVTGLIAHEAFGHGVEMDMFVKNRAKAKEYMGGRVASDVTNMKDGARSYPQVSSYLFDDEGVFGSDTDIIVKGVLKTGICDSLSALRLGILPTGNGKRMNFERKAYTRMTNTFFTEGDSSLNDMIKTIKSGYLLEGFQSGMEDPKNWGIQCVITKGREIKDGQLTGRVVSPVYLTGYVPELLESISMVSKGLKLSGSGYCGKGYKEWVKTSTGGAYIKARGRLG